MIEFDARLVEEAVLLAIDSAPRDQRSRFRSERDRAYLEEDPDTREARFGEIHGRWFEHLRLSEPLRELVREMSPRTGAARPFVRCVVLSSASSEDEGADLHEGPGGRALVIRVSPRTLLDRERVQVLMRRELMHVADMIDPGFGYTRALPEAAKGPSHQSLIRERYRVAWDVTVDGRLAERGLLPDGVERMRRREFLSAFSMLSPRAAEERFDRLYKPSGGDRPSHADLAAFAADPAGEEAADRCALCRFPTRAFHPDPHRLDPEVASLLLTDFPEWRPDQGLCLQCADLYEARREMSVGR